MHLLVKLKAVMAQNACCSGSATLSEAVKLEQEGCTARTSTELRCVSFDIELQTDALIWWATECPWEYSNGQIVSR